MPFGNYDNFADCIAQNADKASPEGFCAWLHFHITGKWPTEMVSTLPEAARTIYLLTFEQNMKAGKGEMESDRRGLASVQAAGWAQSQSGWVHQYQAPQTRTVTGVEVFATGEWTDSSGKTRSWRVGDLDKMMVAFQAHAPLEVPLKIGHSSEAFNRKIATALGIPLEMVTGEMGKGQLALGRVTSLERKGNKLVASFSGVPEPLCDLIEGHLYRAVSAEIEDKVGDYGPAITGVALLGAEEPAVESLAGLETAGIFSKREGAHVMVLQTAKENQDKSNKEANMGETKIEFATIAKGLGLPESASQEDILKAVGELKEKSEFAKGEFAKLQETVKAQAGTIAAMEHRERVSTYAKRAEAWKAVPGTPQELGTRLAEIEEKAGKETAETVAIAYQAASDLAIKAGVLTAQGRVGGNDGGQTDEYEVKVQIFAKEKGISFQKALAQKAIENPAEFNAYNERKATERLA